MKPLTIEELKALPEDSWVWVVNSRLGKSYYSQVVSKPETVFGIITTLIKYPHNYEDYGKDWIAYKNKESVCPHKVCIFPECENQSYCPLALAETISLKEFIKEFEEIIKEEDVEILPPYMKAIIRSHLKEYAEKKGVKYE